MLIKVEIDEELFQRQSDGAYHHFLAIVSRSQLDGKALHPFQTEKTLN